MQSKENIVKPSKLKAVKLTDLPIKHRKFVKAYRETGKKRQSAIIAGYKESSAHVQASRLLKNEKVLAVLEDSIEEAEGVIQALMRSDDEEIRLKAAKETLDRTVGKPKQRTEAVHINITVESMLS